MPRFTRVKAPDTGHEYSVVHVDPDAHIVLDKPGEDSFGRQLPAKHNIHKGGTASVKPDINTGTPEKKESAK